MSIAVVRPQRSPLVTIADADLDRLDSLASAGELAGHSVAEFLATELERAVIRPADKIGPNIVRMNSRVAFRIGTRRDIEVRTLVYPEEYVRRADHGDCVSVMTPLGAALLGLRVGSGMSYEAAHSTTQHVTVVAVLHRSDAVERGSTACDCDSVAVPARDSRHHWNDDDPGPTAA
jgi:regulator of nucleoside diphosphate kinase